MSIEEARKTIAELKAQGSDEDQLIGIFYQMYKEGKIEIEDFEALMQLIGYHLSEEFLQMSDEEQKNIENVPEYEEENTDVEEENEDDEEKAMKLFGK
jgi:hypothetical protein